MTPEAIELITEWWVKCLVWFMILSALPMAVFVGFTVWKATKEMLDHVKRERERGEAIPRGKKGWRVNGPDGQYYVLARDLSLGDHIRPGDFLPFNGAPAPVVGEPVVSWLSEAIVGGVTSV